MYITAPTGAKCASGRNGTYYCQKRDGHTGRHACLYSGPASTRLVEWTDAYSAAYVRPVELTT